MFVEFKVVRGQRRFFRAMRSVFGEAKSEDDWNLAIFSEQEGQLVYRTCCGNTYKVTANGTFMYQGTREGLLRLQPFPRLKWGTVAPHWATLHILLDGREESFELEVVRYETTTPPEWGVEWSDSVRRVLEDPSKAVIISFEGHVKKIVPYSREPGLKSSKLPPPEVEGEGDG
jgi:hypothetical protein